MKIRVPHQTRRPFRNGVTLLELTVVIMVIMAMIGTTMYFGGNIDEWRKGKQASESLREVYAAQRGFLADNPRRTLSSLTESELVPYLPSGGSSLPKPEGLNNNTLTINVKVSPPVLLKEDGTVYDPSGSNEDSLWDVGK